MTENPDSPLPNLTNVDWSSLPVPENDGAANHLKGASVPDIALPATDGGFYNLNQLSGLSVIFIYPRTGRPDQELPDGWDAIPGARGCTPQACAIRDACADLNAAGIDHVFGLSVQDLAYQNELVDRLHLPYPILSDDQFELTDALKLPQFETSGMRLLKRLTMLVRDGTIVQVFYPVFPPDESVKQVLEYMRFGAL